MARFVFLQPHLSLVLVLACPGFGQVDPGPRGGPPGSGGPIPGLTVAEMSRFLEFKAAFEEVEAVADGLGPRFNLDSCVGCHIHPATGGASPAVNPQIAVATKDGAGNQIPPFLSLNGPVREARRVLRLDGSRDGGVVALFTVRGRTDAPAGCSVPQPNFSNIGNFRFRIPSPTFGLGLVEMIPDTTLRENVASNWLAKAAFGIRGKLNASGNDGTVTRFGWKAQNKSLLMFSGEAYNVEMGVTNDLFPTEREESGECSSGGVPENHLDLAAAEPGDVDRFAGFMRMLDQPRPKTPASAAEAADLQRGRQFFELSGCALCHTPSLKTGKSSFGPLSGKTAHLYSDLALHDMGSVLSDNILQGNAGPDEFRTAPLWGVGQRIFFLHDGRTKDLLKAIQMHASSGSEANRSVDVFNSLSPSQKQSVLSFLRSL